MKVVGGSSCVVREISDLEEWLEDRRGVLIHSPFIRARFAPLAGFAGANG